MKRLLLFTVIALCLSSCGTITSLYYWGGIHKETTVYEHLTYKNSSKHSPETICKLICMYEDMVSNPGGTLKAVPPGIHAEYGYMLLNPESAVIFAKYATDAQKKTFKSSDYTSLFPEMGKKMMQKEIELYPESSYFLEPLIERLCK